MNHLWNGRLALFCDLHESSAHKSLLWNRPLDVSVVFSHLLHPTLCNMKFLYPVDKSCLHGISCAWNNDDNMQSYSYAICYHKINIRFIMYESWIEKNWEVFSGILFAGSHENLAVYVSEMENPSFICSSPSQPPLSLCTLLCSH